MRVLLAGGIAGVAAIALAGGCAAQQFQALEPKLELRNAAQQLADAQQAGFTLTVTGNPKDLVAAAGPGADAESVGKLFASSVTLAYDKGGPGADDDKSSLAATVDGVTGTEVRFVDGLVYAKAPVSELAAKFGATPAEVKELSGGTSEFDAFFAGKWVSIDTKSLGAGAATPTTGPDQQKALAEFTTSATNLLEGADIERDSADDKHLIVTSSTAEAYAEAKRFATAVEPSLAAQFKKAPADKPIVLDLWIDKGKLTAAELNVLQFAEGATGRVAARVEVGTPQAIEAPTGATELDLSTMPYFGGGASLSELEKLGE
ncbi:hypothetical protein Aab01nite_52600 [Paractinoplanes abujensis]|uniref:Lipoprotein n=1 Tax=Paractinoplanes abujensis TaxID=882441 RepID=A0A7W7CS55_9ACTN|nr:hypothetical protein [Actinoplanes abujensis]MBB4693673.1 hypothetical protein [Actinoplanes abujensis]GID21670.1 hypothetical protein Aab01nite_52600 [Actinoplanes abujensis]